MAETNQHKVAAAIRQYAEKIAAEKAAAGEGAPDRMTVADGQGGITASKGSVPTDAGEAEVKRNQPTDGTNAPAAQVPSSGPDRMTVADGQGGITASKGTVPTDPGEAEIKKDQPTDGENFKAANISKRAANIRAALIQANPALAQRFAPPADPAATSTPAASTGTEKAAGSATPTAPSIELSQETLCKIARVILSSDAGVRMAHDLLEKQAGEEAARTQILEALQASQAYDESEQIKRAAFDDLSYKTASIHASLTQAGVTEADADSIIKQAAVHQEAIDALEHPLLKAAYAQGMDDAAILAAADEAGGAEGAPPMDEALPMGGDQLGEEEIMALLQEMLASGQITEEDILEAVAATGGGGGEGAPPAPEEAGAGAAQ